MINLLVSVAIFVGVKLTFLRVFASEYNGHIFPLEVNACLGEPYP